MLFILSGNGLVYVEANFKLLSDVMQARANNLASRDKQPSNHQRLSSPRAQTIGYNCQPL